MSVAYESHVCTQLYCIYGNTFIKVMNELNWRIFKFTIVLTSIGLFFAALCILDACIRSYWARKQQRLPRYRTEEILNIRNLVKVDKLFDVERENPRLFFCKPPFNCGFTVHNENQIGLTYELHLFFVSIRS